MALVRSARLLFFCALDFVLVRSFRPELGHRRWRPPVKTRLCGRLGSFLPGHIRAIDLSFSRSGASNEAKGVAELRKVHLIFNVTVPSSTDSSGFTAYIAGTLDSLDGNLSQWDPSATVMTRVDSTHWTITLTGNESTQVQYKYTLGSWDFVEKGGACDEIPNRQIALTYGSDGTVGK